MPRLEFDAVVEASGSGRAGALVSLPPGAADVFGTRARFPVKATFNGVPYRGSTMPTRDGTFCIGITKAIRAEAVADIGQPVHVVVERDDGERTVDVPDDLVAALAAAGMRDRFDAMAFTHRQVYARWVGAPAWPNAVKARKPETRRRRVEKAIEMIAAGQRR